MATATKGRSGGVLQINAAATKKQNASQQSKSTPKSPGPRLRLIIRRLPPGLTETEFWTYIGEEWQQGKGRIDWAAFKDGKVSKDLAKPSRPARVYLKVKDQAALDSLSTRLKEVAFNDAKGTTRDSCLVGPPTLEFAPYSKMPGNRVRHDGRQGTIDQDQEFIDFLQSLTEPIVKSTPNGTEGADLKTEKVTTTPLVQYLKEKKANKAKDAAQAKAAKANKESKPAKGESKTTVVKSTASLGDKAKTAKPTQEVVKVVSKPSTAAQGKQTVAKADVKSPNKEPVSQPAPAKKERERERRDPSAVARMLQRDLGLAPKSPRASRVASAAAASVEPPKVPASSNIEKSSPASVPAQSTVITPAIKDTKATSATTPTTPTGPKAGRTPGVATNKSVSQPTNPKTPKTLPNPSSGAKSAFLKHANPSQGITEELLRTTFATFGTITRCEIDKKKGLGYIDFEDSESLRKAMHASPIKIGNGQVQVLENRSQQARKGTAQQQQSGGTANTGSGQSPATGPSSAPSLTPLNTSTQVPSSTPSSTISSPIRKTATPARTTAAKQVTAPTSPAAAATTPTAPAAARTGNRGGGSAGRGGATARGDGVAGRGNLQSGNRGSQRGGNRGGRGNASGRGGNKGGSVAGNTASSPAPLSAGEGAAATPATTTVAPAPASVPESK